MTITHRKASFDVIIVGGSYAGLSAALSLGRSLRKTLVIDSGAPCNKPAPHTHNFVTHDGSTPSAVLEEAKTQVRRYASVEFVNGLATGSVKENGLYTVRLSSGAEVRAKKLLFATGLADILPDLPGFSACWGISVLHCPYCHGYEVRQQTMGLLGNGEAGFELARLISHWSSDLTLYTNGPSSLTPAQADKLQQHAIPIVEKEIARLEHDQGQVRAIVFKDNSRAHLAAVFARPAFKQHCDLPQQMGCALNAHGFIVVDELQRTTVAGIYAAGDSTTGLRAVSMAVASGTKAGAVINKDLIDEAF